MSEILFKQSIIPMAELLLILKTYVIYLMYGSIQFLKMRMSETNLKLIIFKYAQITIDSIDILDCQKSGR